MKPLHIISATEYNEIKARSAVFDAWVDTKRGKNGWASYKPEEKPADIPDVTNDERSKVEVYEFVNTPPDRYFLYVKALAGTHSGARGVATTWTGDKLGDITFGTTWKDNFGGTRVSIRVSAIDGRTYAGVYFSSAGDCARIKLLKSSVI